MSTSNSIGRANPLFPVPVAGEEGVENEPGVGDAQPQPAGYGESSSLEAEAARAARLERANELGRRLGDHQMSAFAAAGVPVPRDPAKLFRMQDDLRASTRSFVVHLLEPDPALIPATGEELSVLAHGPALGMEAVRSLVGRAPADCFRMLPSARVVEPFLRELVPLGAMLDCFPPGSSNLGMSYAIVHATSGLPAAEDMLLKLRGPEALDFVEREIAQAIPLDELRETRRAGQGWLYFHPASGMLYLGERNVQLPPAVFENIDPEGSQALLEDRCVGGEGTPERRLVLKLLADHFPLPLVELLCRHARLFVQTDTHLPQPLEDVILQRIPPGYAEHLIQELRNVDDGPQGKGPAFYDIATGALVLRPVYGPLSPSTEGKILLATAVALSCLLHEGDVPLQEHKAWLTVCNAAPEARLGPFAAAPQVVWHVACALYSAPLADWLGEIPVEITRGHLQQAYPDAYAFLEALFSQSSHAHRSAPDAVAILRRHLSSKEAANPNDPHLGPLRQQVQWLEWGRQIEG